MGKRLAGGKRDVVASTALDTTTKVEHELSRGLQKKLQMYSGKWVAIVGEDVVASGGTGRSAYNNARRKGHPNAEIFCVPEGGKAYFF